MNSLCSTSSKDIEYIRLKWVLQAIESGRRETSDTDSSEDGVLSIGGEHVGWGGEWIFENPRYISRDFFNAMSSGVIKANDILLVKDGATIGKAAIAERMPSNEAAVNEHVFLLRISDDNFPRYYFYVVQSPSVQEQIWLEVRGAAQPGLSSEFCSKLIVPRPSRPVQESIADYLDRETARLDALVAEKERLLELLAEKRRALITRAVTRGLDPNVPLQDSGIPWLGEIPTHWEVAALKRVAALKSGESITSDLIDIEGDFPVFGGNGLRGFTSVYSHEGEYVLIGRQGALCGNIHYASGRFWASEHAVVVTAGEKCKSKWLSELLVAMNLNQYSQSAAQPGLAVEVIENLRIPVPPILEQREIVEFIVGSTIGIDNLRKITNRTIELLKERRSALIAAAVTGQINVGSAA